MAEELEEVQAQNRRLNEQLLTLHERERAELARGRIRMKYRS